MVALTSRVTSSVAWLGWGSFPVQSLWGLGQVLWWFFLPVGRRSLDWCRNTRLQLRTLQLAAWSRPALLGLGGFGLVSDDVPSCVRGCCQSPRQQDGPGDCSSFLNRAKWHRVLKRRWHLVQLAPGCWGFAVCSNKDENSPS